MVWEITLPWPPQELQPNWRGHWSKKARKASEYKSDCFNATKALKVKLDPGQSPLSVTFHAPNNRPRDLDNLMASIKHAIDGISEATGINDKFFRPITINDGPVEKGGKVVVRFG